MKQSLRLSILTSFILIASILFVSATPVITIHSPIQTEYNSTQILLNVTSNEAIDFFIKDLRGIRNLVLAENTSQLDSYLYLNEGEHEFTIWANNSGGETLQLKDNLGRIIDEHTYSSASNDVSIGRETDAGNTWKNCTTPTKNATNNGVCQ